MKHIELVLHPVRIRIILALANRTLTPQQLADLMPDIAQTTLYRQINVLLEGGVLTVVRESKVRGTVERELALVEGAGRIELEESAALLPEQQEQLFTTFIATLLAEFRQAQLQPQEGVPPAFYSRQRLYLSLEELQHVNQQIDELLSAYKTSTRATDGQVQQWLFTGIIMPDVDMSSTDQETNS